MFFFKLSSPIGSQIWLIHLVDDGECDYIKKLEEILKKKPKNSAYNNA